MSPGTQTGDMGDVRCPSSPDRSDTTKRGSTTTAYDHDAAGTPATGAGPDRKSQEDEQSTKLRRRIAELPELQRVVIERAYLQGYTLREVSEQLNAPLGTVKSASAADLNDCAEPRPIGPCEHCVRNCEARQESARARRSEKTRITRPGWSQDWKPQDFRELRNRTGRPTLKEEMEPDRCRHRIQWHEKS